jgi:hypothetical protein
MNDDDESCFYVADWDNMQVDLRLPYDKLPVRLWQTKTILFEKKEKEKELKVIEEKQESIEL